MTRFDRMFLEVKDELIRRIGQGDSGETCMDLLMIAKYFERIGDHILNIAQEMAKVQEHI